MGEDISSEFLDALGADQLRFAWLLQLPAGLLLTNHETDVTIGADTYMSGGFILSLPNIVRESNIKLQDYSIQLSGIQDTLKTLFSSRNMTGEVCQVFLVLLDGEGVVIDAPVSLYKGTFHTWVERDTENTITLDIKLTSPWSKPNLTAGRMTSNNNQTDRYPGDKFFEFAHEEKKDLGWGRED